MTPVTRGSRRVIVVRAPTCRLPRPSPAPRLRAGPARGRHGPGRGAHARDRRGPADLVEQLCRAQVGHASRAEDGPRAGLAPGAEAAHGGRSRLRGRDLDLAVGGHVLRRHLAHPVLGGHHARPEPGPHRGARTRRERAHRHLGQGRRLEPHQPSPRPPDLVRAGRRPRRGQRRHLAVRRRRHLVAGARDADAPSRLEPRGGPRAGRGGRLRQRHRAPSDLGARPCGRHRPARADVQPDGPRGPLPAVGRRGRGLVLAHLHRDGARPLRHLAAPRRHRRRTRRRRRRPHREDGLRPRLPRHRQLGLQHRVRRHAGGRRLLRHPDARPARGRGPRRGRRARRHLDRLRPRPAHRRPDLGEQRPPARGGRLRGRR